MHAVAKRARQITLWLTADPAELRAEAAPPPAPGELTSRDPVALAEAEILEGEVLVRWDPEGLADERELLPEEIETDPLLVDGIAGDDELDRLGEDEGGAMTPALAQVLEGDEGGDLAEVVAADAVDEEEPEEEDTAVGGPALADEVEEVSLEEVRGDELDQDDEDEDPV